jgi:nucleotide-binding universal stress UspA family protein
MRAEEETMERQMAPSFARILVPLDGSALAEQALPYARAVGGTGAELILQAVVPPAEARSDLDGIELLALGVVPAAADRALQEHVVATVEEVQAQSEAVARERLLAAARTWLDDRTNYTVRVAPGDPAEEILRAVAELGADLVVLASHGRGAVGRAVFGSVADRVAHASPVPAMVVRPRDAASRSDPVLVGRILVPLDGSEIAARALPVAELLARRLERPVHFLHAIDPAQILGPFAGAAVLGPTFFEEAEAKARGWLEDAAERLRSAGVAVTTEIATGVPFATIAGAAQPGDVVVLASHGRGGVRRWLLGSVAEKLVRSGPVPVIVVPVDRRATTEAAKPSPKQAT